MHIVKDIIAKREPMTLQLEYVYILRNHRGKGILDKLMYGQEQRAKQMYPELKKGQLQIFSNNFPSIRTTYRYGYSLSKTYNAENDDILDYLACKEKNIYEKNF